MDKKMIRKRLRNENETWFLSQQRNSKKEPHPSLLIQDKNNFYICIRKRDTWESLISREGPFKIKEIKNRLQETIDKYPNDKVTIEPLEYTRTSKQ